jgi:hypothetical protein
VRRGLKSLIILLLLAGAGIAGLRWALLPWVLSYAQTSIRVLGLPEAVLRQDGLAFANPRIAFYIKASDPQPLLAVTIRFLPTLRSSLMGAAPAIYLSRLELDCAHLPSTPENKPLALPLEPLPPPTLSNFLLSSDEVNINCASLRYQTHKFSLLQQSNGLTLEADGFLRVAEQRFALSGGLYWPQDGAYATSLQLDGGPLQPAYNGVPALPFISLTQKFVDGKFVLTGTMNAASMPLAGLNFENFRLQLNADQRPGTAVPLTANIKLGEQSLVLAGQLDLAKRSASATLTGGLKFGVAEAVGLKADILIPDLTKPTLAEQPFSLTALQLGGLPLTGVSGKLGYMAGQLSLNDAQGLIFGGRVQLSPTKIALPFNTLETTASFSELDLGQIIQLGAVDGLNGVGRLSGLVPITYTAGKLSLGAAELVAKSAGSINYNPAQMPGFMAEGGQGAILGQIFNDFRYDGLALKLGGTLGGQKGDTLTLGVRLAGSNPSFYNGHPVVFNLNLSGALESLLTKGLASFRFSPEDLAQLVKEGEKP